MRSPMLAALVITVACGGPDEEIAPAPAPHQLVLDGPTQVKVDTFGPVGAPQPMLDDGTPVQVVWTVDAPAVATVRGDEISAIGPGEARVTGHWETQSVSWTLVVQPAVSLRFESAPTTVSVGSATTLQVKGRIGTQPAETGPLQWSSSNESLATVQDGQLVGVSPGIVYITAATPASEAMLELEIVP